MPPVPVAAGAPNPFNPAQAAISQPRPAAPAAATNVTSGMTPNPGNPAQAQINQAPKQGQHMNPVGAGVPGPGSSPNPQNPAQPQYGVPAPAPAPVTVDPRDAVYYDNMARLNAAYQGMLNGYTRTVQDAGAAYTQGSQAALTRLGLQQVATRNQANAQGLLESGILGQRADLNTAGYNTTVGNLLSRYGPTGSVIQGASDRLTNFQNNMPLEQKTFLDQAIGRAAGADATNMPTTPGAGGNGSGSGGGGSGGRHGRGAGRRMAAGAAGVGARAANQLQPHPAQRQTLTGPAAHNTFGLGGSPSGRALHGMVGAAMNTFGVGGNLRKQAARKVVKSRG